MSNLNLRTSATGSGIIFMTRPGNKPTKLKAFFSRRTVEMEVPLLDLQELYGTSLEEYARDAWSFVWDVTSAMEDNKGVEEILMALHDLRMSKGSPKSTRQNRETLFNRLGEILAARSLVQQAEADFWNEQRASDAAQSTQED